MTVLDWYRRKNEYEEVLEFLSDKGVRFIDTGGIAPPRSFKLDINRVIFNHPATIIFWNDGSKTVVKCQSGDTYDKEKGFVMAYLKKLLGNKNKFNKEINKWVYGE